MDGVTAKKSSKKVLADAEQKTTGLYLELTDTEIQGLKLLQDSSATRHRAPLIRGAIRLLVWLTRFQQLAKERGDRLVLIQVKEDEQPPLLNSVKVLVANLDLRV